MITKELIKNAKKDEKAFFEIYSYLSNPVFAFVLVRTGNREVSKDILQDVFVDLWKQLSKFIFINEKKFYSFVFLIAKRKISQYFRDKKQHAQLNETTITEIINTDSIDISLKMVNGIKKLNEKDREIVELRYISDLSFKEISKILKISENNAKVRCHRATNKLKQFINQQI